MKKPNVDPKILIVEDDEICRRAIVYKLKLAKISVDESKDGEEALRKMRTFSYRLVLLDLRLPVKDGYQVLQEMRADPKLKDIPVWALSNLGQKEEVEKAVVLGCNEYLMKVDLNIDKLIKKVLNLLSIDSGNQ